LTGTRYIAANRKYADLCDTRPDGFFGKSMLDFCPADLVAKARRDFELFDSGQVIPDREIVFAGRTLLVAVNPSHATAIPASPQWRSRSPISRSRRNWRRR